MKDHFLPLSELALLRMSKQANLGSVAEGNFTLNQCCKSGFAATIS